MASDERLLGTFTDVSGEGFEVLAKGRLVMLRGDQCSTVLLGPQARDELRELLDRAAMPGQAGTERQMCATPDDCPLGPDPHAFVPDSGDTGDGTLPCCRQPWEEAAHRPAT